MLQPKPIAWHGRGSRASLIAKKGRTWPRAVAGAPRPAGRRLRNLGAPCAQSPDHVEYPAVYRAEEYALETFDSDDYRHAPLYDPDDYDTQLCPLVPPRSPPARTALPRALAAQAWGRWRAAAARPRGASRPEAAQSDRNNLWEASPSPSPSHFPDAKQPAPPRLRVPTPGSLLRLLQRLNIALSATLGALGVLLQEGAARAGEALRAVRAAALRRYAGSRVQLALQSWRESWAEAAQEVPEDVWGKAVWAWERPWLRKLRLTVGMANLSYRLPALLALVATQVTLLASQVSLPMLAPLLLGTGMLLRSLRANASFIFPRIGLMVVLLWALWFFQGVVQNTVAYLRKQGALDQRLAGGIITTSEISGLLAAVVILLSMLGINVSALLLPAGVALAVAAQDLTRNFLAGFFLFVVQPFRLGDKVAVGVAGGGPPGSTGPAGPWFEGVCEKVDLRYTCIRSGRRRLMVPNSIFMAREFFVMDDVPAAGGAADNPSMRGPGAPGYAGPQQPLPGLGPHYAGHVWQLVQGPPVHAEVAAAAAAEGSVEGAAVDGEEGGPGAEASPSRPTPRGLRPRGPSQPPAYTTYPFAPGVPPWGPYGPFPPPYTGTH
ncbi:hypothetical protein ACKKBF_B03245 [Auxenochlorella protothecoides x Auxenochlorella symbiontica]